MSEIRNDGALINSLTGLGTGKDKSEATVVAHATQLDQYQQAQLAQNAFMGRVCTAKPYAATRRWCEVALPDADDKQDILQAFDQYRNMVGGESEDQEMIADREIFAWAGYLANVHRGSAIVLDVDDGQPPSEPINVKSIKTIASAQVLDSYKIYPDLSSAMNPWDVTHYNIILSQRSGDRLNAMFDRLKKGRHGYEYKVHRSRVLRIPGVPVPDDIMIWNMGWDRSLIEQVWEEFRDWKAINASTTNLIHDYSLFVYMLEGLSDAVSEGKEDALRQRFQTFRMATSSLGGAAIDKDREKIEFIQRQFGGLDALLDRFRDLWIGATDIPHTKLFGESPSGLGATGESEEKTWADTVEEYQARVFLPRLRRLYRLIWLAKDGPTKGIEPKGWDIKFVPLRQQTEEERMAGMSQFIGALGTAINSQWLLPDEARLSFQNGNEVLNIVLDQGLWDEKKQAEQQQNQFDFGGFGGFEDPGLATPEAELPPEEAPAEEIPPEEPATQLDSLIDTSFYTDLPLYQRIAADAERRFRMDSAFKRDWIAKEYQRHYKATHGTLNDAFDYSRGVRFSEYGEVLEPGGDDAANG